MAKKFDFNKIEEKKEVKTKKSSVYQEDLPDKFKDGLEAFTEISKKKAELKVLEASSNLKELKEYCLDRWCDLGIKGKFKKSIEFCLNSSKFKFISNERWKNIKNEDDINFFKSKFGEENFEKMTTKKTKMTADLNDIQELFGKFIEENKIKDKDAEKFFEFIVNSFKKETSVEFSKDSFEYPDLMQMADGDKETAKKIIATIAYTKPYMK